MTLKLGLIGAGRISPFHIRAARKAGFQIEWICARKNSLNAKYISSKFKIAKVLESIKEIEDHEFHALSIITSTENQYSVFLDALKFGKPILIEKPISINPDELNLIVKNEDISKVIVNLNRRHYKSVQSLKKLIQRNIENMSFVVNIPEFTWDLNPEEQYAKSYFIDNSVHVIDIINYLFGNVIEITAVKTKQSNLPNIAAVCRTNSGAVGTFNISFSSSANISISVFDKKFSYVLKPLELLSVYSGMDTKATNTRYLYKRYNPILHKKIEPMKTKEIGKLGFLGQYLDLRKVVFQGDNDNLKSAKVTDISHAVRVANELIY